MTTPKAHFVRRARDERIKTTHTAQHRPFVQKVMFWGCFSYEGTGPIVPVTGTMTAAKYLATLTEHLVPQMHEWFGAGGGVFQQDNAPCHKARRVTQQFQEWGLEVLSWPPYSPDLAPIENLWAILKAKVHKEGYKTKSELIERVKAIWHADPQIQEACKALVQSMPDRIAACVAAKGGVLKY